MKIGVLTKLSFESRLKHLYDVKGELAGNIRARWKLKVREHSSVKNHVITPEETLTSTIATPFV